MSVYLKGDKWYTQYMLRGEREHYTLPQANSRREAEQMESDDRRLKELGQPLRWKQGEDDKTNTRNMRLSEAAELMYDEVWAENKDGERSKVHVRKIVELTRDAPLHAIDNAFVSGVKRTLKREGLAVSTVNRYLAALRALLTRAHQHWAAIDRIPVFEMYSEKGRERERVVSHREFIKIVDYFHDKKDEQMESLLYVLWYTGARLSEPLSLSWMDVDFNAHTLAFRNTKSGNTRRIKMSGVLESVFKHRRTEDGATIKPFTYTNHTVCHKMKAATAVLGIEGVSCHALRHTVASRLTASGKMSAQAIQKWMGWSSLAMYERYSHLAPTALDAGADVLAADDCTGATDSGVESASA